jgi:hypothetical protein
MKLGGPWAAAHFAHGIKQPCPLCVHFMHLVQRSDKVRRTIQYISCLPEPTLVCVCPESRLKFTLPCETIFINVYAVNLDSISLHFTKYLPSVCAYTVNLYPIHSTLPNICHQCVHILQIYTPFTPLYPISAISVCIYCKSIPHSLHFTQYLLSMYAYTVNLYPIHSTSPNNCYQCIRILQTYISVRCTLPNIFHFLTLYEQKLWSI